MGGGDSGCGIGFLGVTFNKLVKFPDGTAFAFRAHAALSGECNYYLQGQHKQQYLSLVVVLHIMKGNV